MEEPWIIELENKDFKTAIINMLKDLKETNETSRNREHNIWKKYALDGPTAHSIMKK